VQAAAAAAQLGNPLTAGAGAGAGARNFLTARDRRFAAHDGRHVAARRRGTPAAARFRRPARRPAPAAAGSELGSRKPPTVPHKAGALGAERPRAPARALAQPESARADRGRQVTACYRV